MTVVPLPPWTTWPSGSRCSATPAGCASSASCTNAGEATVSDIASQSEVSVANASQHLGRLAMGGIVSRTRRGRSVIYRICEPSIEQLCSIVCASLDTPQASRAEPVARTG